MNKHAKLLRVHAAEMRERNLPGSTTIDQAMRIASYVMIERAQRLAK